MEQYDLVCIGSGPAGEKAATQAAYFNHRVAIVEAHPHPGGAMVNTGTIASKVLRETALLCSTFRRQPIPGITLDLNRGLSVAQLMARKHLIQHQEHDRIEQSIDRHDIDVYRGRARFVDRTTVSVANDDGGQSLIKARYVLIATGSRPARPAHVPFTPGRVVDADGILDLTSLPKRLLVVGGGVIGCEYASIFAELGCAVTVLEPRPTVLPFLDRECAEHLLAAMQAEGIQFSFDRVVDAISVNDESVRALCDDGSTHDADVLLWALGRQGNTEALSLDAIEVTANGRGLIDVNNNYQTTAENIYAAGDVIGFPALASTAMEQGRVAACNMFDIDFKDKLAATLPIAVYTIPAVSMVGMSEQQATEQGVPHVVGRTSYRLNARGRMLGDDQGLLKCVFHRQTHTLLGASVVGEDASEMIHLAQAVIAMHGGIDYFIKACFNYPSLTEMYKYAAYNALQQLATSAPGRLVA